MYIVNLCGDRILLDFLSIKFYMDGGSWFLNIIINQLVCSGNVFSYNFLVIAITVLNN